MERWLPLGMGLLFAAIGLVLPMARLWVRHRVFGVVLHKREDPIERLVAIFFGVTLVLVGVWGVLCAMVPKADLAIWASPSWMTASGVFLALLGLAIVAASQATMGPSLRIGMTDEPTDLVTRGIYGVVRHPIYTGLLAVTAGLTLVTPSPWTVMGFVQVVLVLGLQSRMEDQFMERRHGDTWRSWAARTGRMVPGLGRRGASP